MKSEHGQSVRRHIGIPNGILIFAFGGEMAGAIALDNKLRIVAKEVADIGPKLMLSPEFGPLQLAVS